MLTLDKCRTPRPYLETYLDYLFLPADNYSSQAMAVRPPRMSKSDLERIRPWECFVWSSAMPPSCSDMVEKAFKERSNLGPVSTKVKHRPGKLLGVWTRSEMGLSLEQYHTKSDTVKDLSRVCAEFARLSGDGEAGSQGFAPSRPLELPDPWFSPNLHNVVLLDDSVRKAIPNPFSHIPIPDFDLPVKRRSMARTAIVDLTFETSYRRAFNDTPKDLRAAIDERLAAFQFGFTTTPREFLERGFPAIAEGYVSGDESGAAKENPGDIILLGVIGILEELKDVVSIPPWIASGGLMPNVDASSITERTSWEDITRLDLGLLPKREFDELAEGLRMKPETWVRNYAVDVPHYQAADHTCPATPPTDPSHVHWYQSPVHLLYWIRRGMMALQERGVTLRRGLEDSADLRGPPSQASPGLDQRQRRFAPLPFNEHSRLYSDGSQRRARRDRSPAEQQRQQVGRQMEQLRFTESAQPWSTRDNITDARLRHDSPMGQRTSPEHATRWTNQNIGNGDGSSSPTLSGHRWGASVSDNHGIERRREGQSNRRGEGFRRR